MKHTQSLYYRRQRAMTGLACAATLSVTTLTLAVAPMTPALAQQRQFVPPSTEQEQFAEAYREAKADSDALSDVIRRADTIRTTLEQKPPKNADISIVSSANALHDALLSVNKDTYVSRRASKTGNLLKNIDDLSVQAAQSRQKLANAYEVAKKNGVASLNGLPRQVVAAYDGTPDILETLADQGGTAGTAAFSRGSLKATLTRTAAGINVQIKKVGVRLAPLRKISSTTTQLDELRQTYAEHLPTLSEVLRIERQMSEMATPLENAIDEFNKIDDSNNTAPGTSPTLETIVNISGQTTSVLGSIETLLRKLTKDVFQTEKEKTKSALLAYRGDPNSQFDNAAVARQQSAQTLRDGKAIVSALPTLRAELTLTKGNTKVPDDVFRDLEVAVIGLDVQAELLSKDHTFSPQNWVEERVRLFYFDDVPRLMQVLNKDAGETAGDKNARAQADTARRTMEEATLKLGEARQKVNDARTELARRSATLEIQARAAEDRKKKAGEAKDAARTSRDYARDAARDQQQSLDNADVVVARAEAEETIARTELNAAADALEKAPDDTAKQTEKALRQRQYNAAVTKTLDAKEKRGTLQAALTAGGTNKTRAEADAEAKVNAADAELTAIKTELAGYEEKVAQAEADAKTALSELNQSMTTSALAAFADNQAFAYARDNAPFWRSLPDDKSDDPARHVLIFGFPDRREIFVRGEPTDVAKVQRIISTFDRPEAQAMIHLWTLEVTADYDKSGSRLLSDVTPFVSSSLRKITLTNEKVADALKSELRNEITKRTQPSPPPVQPTFVIPPPPGTGIAASNVQDKNDRALAKEKMTTKQQSTYNSIVTAAEKLTTNPAVQRRLAFFDPNTVLEIGLTEGILSLEDESLTNAFLPSIDTSTVANALVLLSLASDQSQGTVMTEFIKQAGIIRGDKPTESDDKPTEPKDKQRKSSRDRNRLLSEDEKPLLFPHLQTFVGSDIKTNTTFTQRSGVRDFRGKMVAFFRANAVEAVKSYLMRNYVVLSRMDAREWEKEPYKKQVSNTKVVSEWLRANLSGDTSFLMPNSLFPPTPKEGAKIDQAKGKTDQAKPIPADELEKKINNLIAFNPATRARDNAQTAALNDLLKRYIRAYDTDLQEGFVEPGLTEMRERLYDVKRKGWFVGIMQKTSLLTSNRLYAKVDPRFSANLSADILDYSEAAQATATLGMMLGGATGGGGVLPAALQSLIGNNTVGAIRGSLPGVIQGILPGDQPATQNGNSEKGGDGSGDGKEKEEKSDPFPPVYAITGGNTFALTPIFDPTGQALRFKFDYVAASQVREPNKGVDKQFSRIEQHSVNTEVQLSNHEMRLISSYQANAALGAPADRRGGIPILNVIPGLKEIPIIGYFSRRKGITPVSAESLIFAQTSMYPTIDDIVHLLTNPTAGGK